MLLEKWGLAVVLGNNSKPGQDWVDQRAAQVIVTEKLKSVMGKEASTARLWNWTEVVLS